jgi:hypothetical protein
MILWGIERTLDEHLWLGEDGHLGSLLVQIAGVALAAGGIAVLLVARSRWHRWLADDPSGGRPASERNEPTGATAEPAPAGPGTD